MEELGRTLSTSKTWVPIQTLKKLINYESSHPDPTTRALSPKSSKKSPTLPIKTQKNQINSNHYLSLYISSLESQVKSLLSENSILKARVQKLTSENLTLNSELHKLNQDHMIRLQNLQEQHERRLFKSKKDLDYLLKEMNSRSNIIIIQEMINLQKTELENCKMEYLKVIERLLIGKGEERIKDLKEVEKLQKKSLKGRGNKDWNDWVHDYENLSTAFNSERNTWAVERGSMESMNGDLGLIN